MPLELIPETLRGKYHFEEREHACSILAGDFASEWRDLLDCLGDFTLKRSAITVGGGGRSQVPIELDGFLTGRGWHERKFF